MADVRNFVSLHLVWATYDRLPKITSEVMDIVRTCVNEVTSELHCPLIALGGVEDHVHVLIHFSTTVTISDVVQGMKGRSARVINARFPDMHFKWQGGYGVFPVTPQLKKQVVAYIINQKEHHQNRDLKSLLEDTGFYPSNDSQPSHPG